MLKGKTALVTGSTSGIGLGIAKALARQGANIVLNGFGDVDTPRAEVLAAGQASGAQVAYHGADMSRAADIEDMMRYSEAQFGQVDVDHLFTTQAVFVFQNEDHGDAGLGDIQQLGGHFVQ